MEITGHIEVSSNGHCSIYTDAMIGNTVLFGYGDSIEEAKADLWAVIYECREEIRIKKGYLPKELEQINITFVVETDYYKKK